LKIAFITDQHFGVRNDSPIFAEYQAMFYRDVFFPTIKERGIRDVFDLGDTFDRRKFIQFNTLKAAYDMWFTPLYERGIDLHILVGNHCIFYKNTNEVNSPSLLLGDFDNIHVYQEPETIELRDGSELAMLPWMNSGNFKDCMEFIEETPAKVLLGHLEVKGGRMHKDSVNTHGMEAHPFDRFERVFSGHFHTPNQVGKVQYLGAPYEMTWSDYNDPRGFWIFDTESYDMEFIRNPYSMFHKVTYNDSTVESVDTMAAIDMRQYKDRHVKIIVEHKSKPKIFDAFIERMYQANPADLSILEDVSFLNDVRVEVDAEGVDKDTGQLLDEYIDNIDFDREDMNRTKLKSLLRGIHAEAQEID
jgi:DNA repair exonuclease SbcCD nuclease subunit